MPRRGRLVVPEVAHRVTQRGNNRQVVFDSDFDRQLFLDLLAGYAPRHRLSVLEIEPIAGSTREIAA
ncbi:MAG: hypothetical protein ACKV22_37755 [Bryobacteraceae bacterium]